MIATVLRRLPFIQYIDLHNYNEIYLFNSQHTRQLLMDPNGEKRLRRLDSVTSHGMLLIYTLVLIFISSSSL